MGLPLHTMLFAIALTSSIAGTDPVERNLELLWSVGGNNADEIYGVLSDVITHPSGDAYVLDSQLATVHRIARDGRVLVSFGRRGEGPGEFQFPRSLARLPNGNILVGQPRPRRYSTFDPSGLYLGEWDGLRRVGDAVVIRVHEGDRCAVVQRTSFTHSESAMNTVQDLLLLSGSSEEPIVLAVGRTELEFSAPVRREEDSVPFRWEPGPEGTVVVAPSTDYRIDVFDATGEHSARVAPEFESVARTRERLEEVEARFRAGGGTDGVEFAPLSHEPDIQWFDVDGQGRLWVLSSRGAVQASADSLGRFDVWTSDGRFLKTIDLHGEGDPKRDRYVIDGDRLYVLQRYGDAFANWRASLPGGASSVGGDESGAEPMAILCYRLPALD